VRRLLPALALALALFAPTACGLVDRPDPTPVALTVFLDREATPQQRDAVAQRLRSMPSTRDVTFESREQAYENFKKTFADTPDLMAGTRPETLPEAWHATVVDGSIAEAIELVMSGEPGVADAALVLGRGSHRPAQVGVILRMSDGATDADVDAARRAAAAIAEAARVTVEDGPAAYARLRERCAGRGDLVTALGAVEHPASIRFRVGARPNEAPGLMDLRRMHGVGDLFLVPVETL
jgi:hypothetical protein